MTYIVSRAVELHPMTRAAERARRTDPLELALDELLDDPSTECLTCGAPCADRDPTCLECCSCRSMLRRAGGSS